MINQSGCGLCHIWINDLVYQILTYIYIIGYGIPVATFFWGLSKCGLSSKRGFLMRIFEADLG
jgi:hypothetical protein